MQVFFRRLREGSISVINRTSSSSVCGGRANKKKPLFIDRQSNVTFSYLRCQSCAPRTVNVGFNQLRDHSSVIEAWLGRKKQAMTRPYPASLTEISLLKRIPSRLSERLQDVQDRKSTKKQYVEMMCQPNQKRGYWGKRCYLEMTR